MSNSIFMLSKYLKKTVTTALILGLMISPILPATQSISSSISIATQAAEIEVQLEEAQTEEAQATTGYWSEYTNTAWYDENKNEYSIRTAEELAGLAKLVNDGTCNFAGKTIKLTDNIDLENHEWVPIGVDKYTTFKGNFDGQGHIIKNMFIGTSKKNPANYEFVGLFGIVENATIKDINISDSCKIYNSLDADTSDVNRISEKEVYIGGVCGNAKNNSTITGSTNAGTVYAVDGLIQGIHAGGICGLCSGGTISSCVNSGIVYSEDNHTIEIGGICGKATATTISSCSNSGSIESGASMRDDCAGGICGEADCGATILNCNNIGCVSYNGIYDNSTGGGICGKADHHVTIVNCYNSETIKNFSMEGGICGKLYGDSKIDNCINTKAVLTSSDEDWAGEICGLCSGGTISNSYYTISTTKNGIGKREDQIGQTTALPKEQMIVASKADIEANFVDITVNGNSLGKIALVDALNKWVEDNDTGDDTGNSLVFWTQSAEKNNGYPYLIIE